MGRHSSSIFNSSSSNFIAKGSIFKLKVKFKQVPNDDHQMSVAERQAPELKRGRVDVQWGGGTPWSDIQSWIPYYVT